MTEQEERHLAKYQGDYYIVTGPFVRGMIKLMHQLYLERRLDGDTQRDWAQVIDWQFFGAGCEVEEYEIKD